MSSPKVWEVVMEREPLGNAGRVDEERADEERATIRENAAGYDVPSAESGGWIALNRHSPAAVPVIPHPGEQHEEQVSGKLNWLRAGVLGANDGIVSVAGTIIGVAGADPNPRSLLTAGIAALAAGAFSMAGGEYVSVSAQRDTEKALLAKERWELETMPAQELDELAQIYESKGMTATTALKAADEAMRHDALRAHSIDELGVDPGELTNPWSAAFSSFLSFVTGGLIPLVFSLLPAAVPVRMTLIVLSVALALTVTGFVSARLGGAPRRRAMIRNVAMGLGTMVFAWVVGALFGVVA